MAPRKRLVVHTTHENKQLRARKLCTTPARASPKNGSGFIPVQAPHHVTQQLDRIATTAG